MSDLGARGAAWLGRLLLPLTIVGLVAGLLAAWAGRTELADLAWAIPSAIVAVRLAWSILVDLRAGRAGVDIVAILAIGGALILGEFLAASVIAFLIATSAPLT